MRPHFRRQFVFAATFSLALAAACAAHVFLTRAEAAVPRIVNYQGRLEDKSGNLHGGAGTDFDFKFSVWNASSASAGVRLWPAAAPASTTHRVTNGVFDARIGDAAQGFGTLDLDFNTSTVLYLQIEVYNTSTAAFETLDPRQPIVSAGFAINADTVDGADAGTSANNVLKLDPSGGINLQSGSSTFGGPVTFSSTTSLQGFTFTNATGTGNLQAATLVLTAGATLQSTLAVSGASSLQGVTFTNATGTNITTTNLTVTGTCTGCGLSGSGTSTQLAIWSGGSSLTSDAFLTVTTGTQPRLTINPATTSAGTGLRVAGHSLVGRGISGIGFSEATVPDSTKTFYIAEQTSQAPLVSQLLYVVPVFDSDLVGTNISSAQYNVLFAEGYGDSAASANVFGQRIQMAADALFVTATTSTLVSVQGLNINTDIVFPAGSTGAATESYGVYVESLNLTNAAPTRSYGVRAVPGNGSTAWAGLFAGDLQVTAANKYVIGGGTTNKSGNYLQAGSALATNAASSTIDIGIDNTDVYRIERGTIKPITTNVKDLGSATTTWRSIFIGTTLNSSGTLNVSGASTLAGAVSAKASLAVATSSQASATTTLTVCAAANCTLPAAATGTDTVAFFASTGGATTDTSIVARGVITSGLADIGEYVRVVGNESDYEAGDLLSISTAEPGKFEKPRRASDPLLAGVVTETAGLVAGGGEDSRGNIILALAGRLPVKVNGQGGPIAPGDYLTSSGAPGEAMRTETGVRVVAIAMEAFSGAVQSDKGEILAFLVNGLPAAPIGGNLLQAQNVAPVVIHNTTLDPERTYSLRNLEVQHLTIGSEDRPTGFQIFDVATRAPYCVRVRGGTLEAVAGRCGALGENAENTPPAPPPPAPFNVTSSPPLPEPPPHIPSEPSLSAEAPPPEPSLHAAQETDSPREEPSQSGEE
ncbi:MAG: hypothetical protein HY436_01605 [Candidatus Liptonbacteria bacterium]|nr:hypothetical protein [Candidatus Liptonbacteria bacterium]